MAAIETPWKDLFDINVEVMKPGAGWSPINCDIKTLHAAGGRAEWSAQMDPSVMTAVLENFDGTVLVSAGWKIRISISLHGVPHQLFIGMVHDATRQMKPNGMATVKIHAADDMRQLATTYLEELDTSDPLAAVGIGDSFKERVDRILDAAGWPTAARDLDNTLNWRLEGTWYGRSALEELHLLARSVGGWVYLNRAGKIATGFPDDQTHPRWHLFAMENPTNPHPICPSIFQVDESLDYVVNYVHLRHRSGTSWVTAQDSASQSKYGHRAFVESDLQNLHHLSDLAQHIIDLSKEPRERLKSVTVPIVNGQSASLFDTFEMGDVVELEYQHEAPVWGFDKAEGFIVGWTVDIDTVKAVLTLNTGHPLDTRPQAQTTGGTGSTSGGSGATGPTGATGPQGSRGTMWFEGASDPDQYPPPSGGFMIGDVYLHTTDGEIFTYTSTGWHDEGISLRGPQGPTGPHGSAVTVLGTVPTVGDLPDPAGHHAPHDGDVHYVTDDGDLYIFEHLPGDPALGAWHDMGHVQGPQGIQGLEGPRGAVDFATADNRYLRLNTANDPLTNELRINGELFIDPTGEGRGWKAVTRQYGLEWQADESVGSFTELFYTGHGNTYLQVHSHAATPYMVFGIPEVRVGVSPRPGSQIRNVSHGHDAPPSNMRPGDIHLRY